MERIKEFLKDKAHQALLLIVALFTLQSLILIFTIKPGIPLDEIYHIGVSHVQSLDTNPFNNNSDQTAYLGDISRRQFLYHYLNGRLIHLNLFDLQEYQFYRLISLFYSSILLVYIYKLAFLVSKDKKIALFGLILMSQTIMFVFLSASVSYDNLVNVLALAGFYYLLALYLEKNSSYFLKFIFVLLLGILTKRTFLALLPIYSIIFFCIILIQRKEFLADLAIRFNKQKRSFLVLCIGIALALSANGALYIGNKVQYGNLLPYCSQVIGHTACLNNPVYKESYELAQKQKDSPAERIKFTLFIYKWIRNMVGTTFGVLADNGNIRIHNKIAVALYVFVFTVGIGLFIQSIVKNKKDTVSFILLFAFLAYTVILFISNYFDYVDTGLYGRTVHGKYLFPVFSLLVCFTAKQYTRFTRFITYRFLLALFLLLFTFSYLDFLLNAPIYIRL